LGGRSDVAVQARLRRGAVVLVATPGRLLDHLRSTAAFATAQLAWLVLDEADRLLEMGLGETVREAVELLEQRRAEPVERLCASSL
jgi:ATP-dependent RNA helicase DDX31/DBP7